MQRNDPRWGQGVHEGTPGPTRASIDTRTLESRYVPFGGLLMLALLSLSVFGTAAIGPAGTVMRIALAILLTVVALAYLSEHGALVLPGRLSVLLLFSFLGVLTVSTAITGRLVDLVTVALLAYSAVILLYIVPAVSDVTDFLHWLSVLSGVLGAIALLSLLTGEVSLGILSVTVNEADSVTFPGIETAVAPPRSIFGNQNGLAHLTGAGTLASVIMLHLTRARVYAATLAVSAPALYLTGSRAGLLLAGVGLGTIVAVAPFEWKNRRTALVLGVNGTVVAMSVALFSLLATPFSIFRFVPFDFSSRLLLWDATVRVFRENWLTGIGYTRSNDPIRPYLPSHLQGLSPHSSYLRVFMHAGVVGGTLYIGFVYAVASGLARATRDRIDVLLAGFVLAIAVVQLFETFSFLGYSHQSIISILALGYGIQRLDDVGERRSTPGQSS